ncbi:hypothetical protein CYMTET_52705 [Cymbomonas tetramitiformis]|uniref:Cytochrome b5 heme-binding domain-containing protein n=1 Tax=Cymbomonas tetramitiformis TaxID=36881 RepID=A0AAE0BJV9_9CHLO|nr:hypothetical protein CYMTET_52705 [Cymbomonas tetramitiformis]|eukprot:gene9399-11135_t
MSQAADPSAKIISRDEVSRHNTENDCWIIVDKYVYDVTKFQKFHPGGKWVINQVAGQDATEAFYAMHRADVLSKYHKRLCIGVVSGEEKAKSSFLEPGELSAVPYAESSAWAPAHKSPFFQETHFAFRKAVRAFFDEHITPIAVSSDEDGEEPSVEVYKKLGKVGLNAARMGPGPWMATPGIELLGGLKPQEFDCFHEMIVHEEFARIGTPGFTDGLGAGLVIGLPPVLHFGTKDLAMKVGREVILGEKRICLAITDPGAGSDVANLSATAEKTPCGRFYIVNGVKKWITNGSFADYFVTAVRTGGKGIGGISLLLVERSEGLTTKKIKTSYSPAAGTAYVFYDNVKVPVENLLGKENQGFRCIMANFNHERWMIVCGVNRTSRLLLEECLKWANQRKVFGKPLISQPVIRNKLAHMVAQVESVQNWTENITFQMQNMSYADQAKHLAGPIALLKLQCTRVAQFVLDEACQIFGGRAITRTGMGQVVERFQRAVKFGAILGGSEEIMADLGIRQAVKNFPNAKL